MPTLATSWKTAAWSWRAPPKALPTIRMSRSFTWACPSRVRPASRTRSFTGVANGGWHKDIHSLLTSHLQHLTSTMNSYCDTAERQDPEQRERALMRCLPELIRIALQTPGWRGILGD